MIRTYDNEPSIHLASRVMGRGTTERCVTTAFLLGQLSALAEREREAHLAALIAAHSGEGN
jgi:hypothetical protein